MSILQRLINEQQFQVIMGLPSEVVYISMNDFRALEVEMDLNASSSFEPIIMTLFVVRMPYPISADMGSVWMTSLPFIGGRSAVYKPTASPGNAISGNAPQPLTPPPPQPTLMKGLASWIPQITYVDESRAHTDASPGCRHEYKRYDGLLESFEYCVKCDGKRE